MNELANEVIEAHGGLDRWTRFETMSAHLLQGGALWALKGKAGVLDDTSVTVSLRREWASHHPFGTPGTKSVFTPDLVRLLGPDGGTRESLPAPRASFEGHTLETPWSDLQLAYFAGIAMWTYLNMPFLLARPGVVAKEVAPYEVGGERVRRLRVIFPPRIATHSNVQTLHVDDDGLLRRHDYDVEIAGNTPGAHFISDYVEVEGIMVPTKRRIYPRQHDGTAMTMPLVVSIDLDTIELR